jgi:DNA (cytosine-5)-methyltransferase 1
VSFYGVKLHRSDILRLGDDSQACTEETFVEWCTEQIDSDCRLAVDLFSGAGGLSLGLQQAEWTVAMSIDHDVRALETHRANFSGLALNVDLGDPQERARIIGILKQTTVDLIAGGPPCQPFSRAGRSKIKSLVDAGTRDPEDHRKELWKAYLEIVVSVRPRAVLMENVPDMALGDDFSAVRAIVDKLENSGYHTLIQLVDASAYGVPQHRKRLIVLARLDGNEFTWPEKDSRITTLWEAIGDLPRLPEDDPVGDRSLPYLPPAENSDYAKRMRKNVERPDRVWDHMTRPVRDDDLETFKLMDSKTLYSKIPEHLRRYKAETFDDKYKRLDWNGLSRSITAHIAKDGYWYIHPEQHRTLTVREAARIQTFPDDFRFSGTRSDAFRQIGNAVPPLLGEAAAKALAPYEDGRPAGSSVPNEWLDLHRELTTWAEKQRKGPSWFTFPRHASDQKLSLTNQAIAVVVAVLGPSRVEAHSLGEVLRSLKGSIDLRREDLEKICVAIQDTRTIARLDRLWELIDRPEVWKDPVKLVEALKLKPAETAIYRLLLGEDVMLVSQPVLRVAAKLFDSKSDKINRLTDGRIELARLVGGGLDAPLRMAALARIATTNCRPKEQICGTCPLQQWCSTARQRPVSTS